MMDVILQASCQDYAHRLYLYATHKGLKVFPQNEGFGEEVEEVGPIETEHRGPSLVLLRRCKASRLSFVHLLNSSFLQRYVMRMYWCDHEASSIEEAVRHIRSLLEPLMPPGSLQLDPEAPREKPPDCSSSAPAHEREERSPLPLQLVRQSHQPTDLTAKIPSRMNGSNPPATSRRTTGVLDCMHKHGGRCGLRCGVDLPVGEPREKGDGEVEEKVRDGTTEEGSATKEARVSAPPKLLLRIQAYPRHLEETLGSLLPEVDLSPRGFTHVLHLVEAEGRYRFSVTPGVEQYLLPCDKESMMKGSPSKAISKLEEVLSITGFSLDLSMNVADLGAAPGAWTEYFSERVGRVVAIDPADLRTSGDLRHNVTHIKKKAEDAMEDILAWGAGGLSDILVCDMNKHPSQVMGTAAAVLPLLRSGGLFVMTLKFFGRGWDKSTQVQEVKDALGGYLETSECVWLLANTVYERTFIGIRS